MHSARLRLGLLGFILFVGVILVVVWNQGRQPSPSSSEPVEESPHPDPAPPDPRLTFQTPFRNVHPDVQYVGDASCARCHPAIDKTYHAHPMGRSAAWFAHVDVIERFGPDAKNPFLSGPYEARAERAPGGLLHRISARKPMEGKLEDYVLQANLVIGTGERGRSYLSVERGAVWQSPMSWYASGQRWNLSPGFDLGNGGRWPITTECLFCHVNRVEPIAGSINRFREPLFAGEQVSIGCERCHGPGQLHVTERGGGLNPDGVDTSIVNPRHLPEDLRASICEQCHLGGQERVTRRGRSLFEFRPGLPFEQFATVTVRPAELIDERHSSGQFEQMERSRCFSGSGGRLGCTSCHDPHSTPSQATRESFYRSRCLTCHESKGCTASNMERQTKADSCIACHMPPSGSSNIAHSSVTNHLIPRRPGERKGGTRQLASGSPPLSVYRTGRHAPPAAERERDLGVVLARLAFKVPPDATGVRHSVADLAIDRLAASLETWPGDHETWTSLSVAQGVRRDPPARYRAAAMAAKLAPSFEAAQTELAEAALSVGKLEESITAASRVIEMSPTTLEPYLIRASAYLSGQNWQKADDDCRAALRIQPLHPQARMMLAACRQHLGDREGSLREKETALRLATSPGQRSSLTDWYQRMVR